MCAKIKQNLNNILGVLFLVLGTAAFFNTLKFAFGRDIWYDEVFSLCFAKKSYGDIVSLTARDVHPPLYYFYLRFVTSIVTGIFGEGSFYAAAKLASCLPWLGLMALAVTYIRKRFGILTAGMFMFLISVMPQIPIYYVEIRMYSFALFLITAHILTADRILSGEGDRKRLFILFFVLGILTAYTQYYACIATAGIYLAVGIISLFQKGDDRKQILIGVTASAVISVIAYLPWLGVIKRQMDNISGKYWIQPLTLRSILGCIKFATLPVVYAGRMPEISAGLLILTVTVILAIYLFASKRAAKKDGLQLFVLMLMPVIVVIASGFVLSALGTPIFVYRYMVPALGGAWLLVAIAVSEVMNKALERRLGALLYLLILPVILAGALNYKGFCDEESKKVYEEAAAMNLVDSIPTGSVIITNFDHVTAVMGFYRPDCEVYLYDAEIDKLLPDMLGSIRDDAGDDMLDYFLQSGKEVYFFGSFASREDIVKNWESEGIGAYRRASILIERYWIDVFDLHD